jgi:site-specific DNA-methyltransferase (adenine-specific)
MTDKVTIGAATFWLGDCLEVMRNFKDIDLIVTDPPYIINYKTGHRKDKNHDFCSPIQGDADYELISMFIRISQRILKNNSAIYVFCNSTNVDFFQQQLRLRFSIRNMIIWVKNNWTAGDLEYSYGRQYEIIFLGNKGKKKYNGKRLSDVWDCRRVVGKWQEHQNEKPIALLQQCIKGHSDKGDIVLDPFMGSGTTAIACYNTGRKFIGIEKEKKYFDIAVARYRRETAQLRIGDIYENNIS